MPSAAFLEAAKKADRQPVVLMSVESIAALKASSDTKTAWTEAKSGASTLHIEGNTVNLKYNLADWYSHWAIREYYDGASPPYGTWTATYAGYFVEIGAVFQWIPSDRTPVFWLEIFNHVGALVYTTPQVINPPVVWSAPEGGGVDESFSQNYIFVIPPQLVAAGETITIKLGTSTLGYFSDGHGASDSGHSKLNLNYSPIPRMGGFGFIHSAGAIQTRTLDLGSTPSENSILEIDDTVPTGCGITYTARGSANGTAWTNLGTVIDGQELAPYRYYDVTATLTTGAPGMFSPTLLAIRIREALTDNYSTHKDIPIQGAKPYIIEGSVSSLASKIQLMGATSTGELSLKLAWTKKTSDMLATGYLKNKAVVCKLGFLGLGESDFEPYFTGSWYDHSDDPQQQHISVSTRDVWKQFKTKIPDNDFFLDGTGKKIAGKPYTLTGNIIDVILSIVDIAAVPDRFIDRAAFTALKAASFDSADWVVTRYLTEATDADKLLIELAVSARIFLPVMPDGRLTPIHYDTVVAGTPAATLDARKYTFSNLDGNQNELYPLQVIYYQLNPGKSGSSKEDYAKVHVLPNTEAITLWNEPPKSKEWLDKWGLPAATIEALAQWMDNFFAVPRATVKVSGLPPKYIDLKQGKVIDVDYLQLPAPKANWPGYSDSKKFLVMSQGMNPKDFTLSLELLEIGPTTYIPGGLPAYEAWGLFPPVTGLTAQESVVQRGNGLVDHIVVLQFAQPVDFHYGSAEVWLAAGTADPVFIRPVAFNASANTPWVEVPVTVGITYTFYVVTINAANLRQPLSIAPQITKTITGTSELAYAPPDAPPDRDLPGIVVKPPPSGTLDAITGLELFGQGNATEFVGKDAKFRWNRYTFSFSLGEAMGPAGGPLDRLLKGYIVTVKDIGGTTRREEHNQQQETYTYTLENNQLDGSGTPAVAFTCEVVAEDSLGNLSEPATITVNNPQATVVTGLTLLALANGLSISFTPHTDSDIAYYNIHGSQTAGFTPGSGNLWNKGPETSMFKGGLASGTWYVKVTAVHLFGEADLVYAVASIAVADLLVLPAQIYPMLRTDFLVRDSIFYFGDSGSSPTAGTETTLYWTDGYIIRDGVAYALAAGNITNCQYRYIVATLADYTATLSKVDNMSFMTDLAANQVVIANTSNVPNSAGNYICYVRQANSMQIEGADIRDATILNAHIKDAEIEAAKIKSLSAELVNAVEINASSIKTGALIIGVGEAFTETGARITAYASYGSTPDACIDLQLHWLNATSKIDSRANDYGIYLHNDYVNSVTTVRRPGYQIYSVVTPIEAGSWCYGAKFKVDDATYQTGAPLIISPSSSASAPTHTAEAGSLWVTSAGVLYINTDSATTWQKIGAQ